MGIKRIYDRLFEEYGSQGWWPVTPVGGCKGVKPEGPIYGVALKNEKQKIEIIFGAILTQNTSWKNVEKAIISLNNEDLINVDKIIKIDKTELAAVIKSAGYYNQKALKLKNIAEFLKKYPIKALENMELGKARELLLAVNGVGPETADSILLYALNKPIFVVDAYTKRMFDNLGLIKKDDSYDNVQEFFMKNLPADAKLFNEYHALIVEHAKRYYSKKPYGTKCFLRG